MTATVTSGWIPAPQQPLVALRNWRVLHPTLGTDLGRIRWPPCSPECGLEGTAGQPAARAHVSSPQEILRGLGLKCANPPKGHACTPVSSCSPNPCCKGRPAYGDLGGASRAPERLPREWLGAQSCSLGFGDISASLPRSGCVTGLGRHAAGRSLHPQGAGLHWEPLGEGTGCHGFNGGPQTLTILEPQDGPTYKQGVCGCERFRVWGQVMQVCTPAPETDRDTGSSHKPPARTR